MNWLFIDTSGSYLTVALHLNGEFKIKYLEDLGLKHSITLMPLIEEILQENFVSVNDIDCFACTIGPGSFTGIRIGISTVKALSFATNKNLLGVTTFELLAYNKEVKNRLAVISAGHNNYYVMGFIDNSVSIKPSFLTKEQVLELSKTYTVYTDAEIDGVKFIKVSQNVNVFSVVQENLKNATKNRESLVPLYVRKSQAEENA